MGEQNIQELLLRSVEFHEKYSTKIEQLISVSEERIDRVNLMVQNLTDAVRSNNDTLNRITTEYCKHIDGLANCRDSLIEQNTLLLKSQATLFKELKESNERTTSMIEKLFDLAKTKHSENNITLK